MTLNIHEASNGGTDKRKGHENVSYEALRSNAASRIVSRCSIVGLPWREGRSFPAGVSVKQAYTIICQPVDSFCHKSDDLFHKAIGPNRKQLTSKAYDDKVNFLEDFYMQRMRIKAR